MRAYVIDDGDSPNVLGFEAIATPDELRARFAAGERSRSTVREGRRTLEAILDGRDPRLFAVVGPCSIHDTDAALEYARRLRALADEVADTLYVLMRVYLEKPRTSLGWRGLVNDPFMDDSFRIDVGIERARSLLLQVNELGVPAATEALDPIGPQYYGDLVTWTVIGARTSESQTHREMASSLATPVGFKNRTDGDVAPAVNAMASATRRHAFLGIDGRGRPAIVRTRGIRYPQLVLRGGGGRSNFDQDSVRMAEQALRGVGLREDIVIDCSHGNSFRDPERQASALRDVVAQLRAGNRSIVGVMVESFLVSGCQPIGRRESLEYGRSVTDPCASWEATVAMLREARALAAEAVRRRDRGCG